MVLLRTIKMDDDSVLDVGSLDGRALEVARCLFFHGPTRDGDVPSKEGRNSLIAAGYAFHVRGYSSLTENGVRLCEATGLDREREIWLREKRELSDRQQRAYGALGAAVSLLFSEGAASDQLRQMGDGVLTKIIAAAKAKS